MRNETRRERYNNKSTTAKKLPIEVCTINFQCEENVAFVLRSAACFGARSVNVIGTIPSHKELVARSGTLQDMIRINQFANPTDFVQHCRANKIKLISAELDSESVSIHSYDFAKDLANYNSICVVAGHETLGVPVEILNNSTKIYIDMPGIGFCLNTSQTANIFLYEMSKQLLKTTINV